jgi:BirA family transcriptional regulator, biotin operon repressor / biotin---[acetyl-CoA-carboxylase] ligase
MTTSASTAMTGWLARLERFDVVTSTNDVVAEWLGAGTPEVCVAIAEEQTAGRGRNGRTWTAPSRSSLLTSIGFRPSWLAPEHVWRLGAIVALAMAEAGEAMAAARPGSIQLKWPNDLVSIDRSTGHVRKLAGLLGETDGLGTDDPRAIIGIGINADWARADFPEGLTETMTSLSELAGGRPIDRDRLVEAFLGRLEALVEALRASGFPAEDWRRRQLTNGAHVRLEWPDGAVEPVRAEDVDTETGALVIRDLDGGRVRSVLVGEIRHVRLGAVV